MRKQFILLTLFVLLSGHISAQAQLRKASDYFPLRVGNAWQYKPNPDFYPDRHIEIVEDTLLSDTLRIYKALIKYTDNPNAGVGFNYYHYSSDSTVVYHYVDFPETPTTGLPII